jgi:mono/diheme cytochrome c family protein
MRPRAAVLALGLAVLPGACEKHEFEPPSRDAQVAQADSLYSPVLFDSITWPGDSARTFEGNNVFATHCRKCHGVMGEGGTTEYAAVQGLEVPSLVRPEWPEGDDVEALRRRIFTGHPAGMPTWGVAGITPREIDAVAWYIAHDLRPEVLGGGR